MVGMATNSRADANCPAYAVTYRESVRAFFDPVHDFGDRRYHSKCRPIRERASHSANPRNGSARAVEIPSEGENITKYGAKICATFATWLRDFCATLREYDASS
jgi:hypothetical protein